MVCVCHIVIQVFGFLQLTHNIFDFVLNLWNNQMSRFDEYLTQNELQNAHMMLEYAHLTLKGQTCGLDIH